MRNDEMDCHKITRYLKSAGASWQYITQLGTPTPQRSMNAIMGSERSMPRTSGQK